MREGIPGLAVRLLVADDTRLHTTLLADALKRDGAFEVMGSDSQELISRAHLQRHRCSSPQFRARWSGPVAGSRLCGGACAAPETSAPIVLLDSSKNESVLEAFQGRGPRGAEQTRINCDLEHVRKTRASGGQIWADSRATGVVGSRPSVLFA